MSKDQFYLSASRIKTYLGCSWQYWAKYHLKIPEKQNAGAARGNVCHEVLEILLDPKYKHWYDYIIEKQTCKGIKGLEKIIKEARAKFQVEEKHDNKGNHNGELIDEMIYNACCYDFFCDGWELEKPEKEFNFINKNPYYAIRGFIDKHARKRKRGLIRDYKSSNEIRKEDHELQGLIYSLYLLKVEQALSFVEFQFLRFPENPIVSFEFDEDELLGAEEWLAEIQATLENFDEETAYSHFAADDGWPDKKKNEGFKGLAMCGYGKFPGHCYSDTHDDPAKRGNPYFVCGYKWPLDYYVSTKDNIIEESAFEKEGLEKKRGHKIEKRRYMGCPKFNKLNYE